MADNDFRSYRSRDAMAPRSAATPSRPHSDDPLAELARLIGQSEAPGDYDREARNVPSLDVPAEGVDWAAEDRYADQSEPAEADYDARGDERYLPAQQADVVPAYRAGASYDREAEPQLDGQYSPPARSFNGVRDYALPERARFRDEQEPVGSLGRQLPGFAPRRATNATMMTRRSKASRIKITHWRTTRRKPPLAAGAAALSS